MTKAIAGQRGRAGAVDVHWTAHFVWFVMSNCGRVCVLFCVNRYELLLQISGVVGIIIGVGGSLWVLMEGGMKRVEGAG